MDLQQNSSANDPLPIKCTLSGALVSGVTPTIKVCKAGGSEVSTTGSVTASNSFGDSYYTPSATDCNTQGSLVIHVSGTGIDSYSIHGYQVKPDNPFTRFPATAPGTTNGLARVADVPTTASNAAAAAAAILQNPAFLIATDISGQVTANEVSGDVLGSVNGSIGGGVGGDLSGRVLGGGATPFQGTGVWALDDTGVSIHTALGTLQTAVSNLNNLSALAVLYGPTAMEVPASSSIAYTFTLLVKDAEGHMEDLSASPTIVATNAAGTDRSANLSVVTHTPTGQYSFTYTVAAGATQEGITIKATGTAASDATSRIAVVNVAVVAVDTSTAITAIKAQTDKLTFTGSNVNSEVQGYGTGQAPPSAGLIISTLWTDLTNGSDFGTAGSIGALIVANLDAKVSTRLASTGYTAPDNADIVSALADLVALLARTDPTSALGAVKAVTDRVSSMLAVSGGNWTYTVDALKNAPAGGGGGGTTNLTAEITEVRAQ